MPRLRPNIVLVAVILAGLVYIAGKDVYIDRHLTYGLSRDALVIRYHGRVVLPYREIRNVTFFSKPPSLKGSWLATLGRSRLGLFYLPGVGQVEMYSADEKRPLIVVLKGYRLYGLAPREGERFYRALLSRLPGRSTGESIGAED